MQDLFKPIYLDIKNKKRNLDVVVNSKVKSTKFFPVFMIDGEEYIFKPLSKTKPLTTPLFAYSEVFWSYITNKHLDAKTPVYNLAYCKGVSNEQSKYYEQGVLVKSVLKDNQKFLDLWEYFNQIPEDVVGIKDYINYCMKSYDYTQILQYISSKMDDRYAREIARQVLYSILRADQNFHYGNVSFLTENDKIIDIVPPLDFEFSTMFLYPDNKESYELYMEQYLNALNMKTEQEKALDDFFTQLAAQSNHTYKKLTNQLNNICYITKTYPNIVKDFLEKLDAIALEVELFTFNDLDNYIGLLNSDYWEVGHARYKENDENKAQKLEQKLSLVQIDKEKFFANIKENILHNIAKLKEILTMYLNCIDNNIENLEDMTVEEYKNVLRK